MAQVIVTRSFAFFPSNPLSLLHRLLPVAGLAFAVIVNVGWIGFLAVVPWIQALGWAFMPTTVRDVRYLPKERQHDTEEMIAKLTGKAPPEIAPPETTIGKSTTS